MDHQASSSKDNPGRPNIIIILADDLGFSDVGCFGSEIQTPNIDSLAYDGGIRFTQMYNCARCCPSRASLLTGMYPHQAGIGHMVYDAGVGPEYQGYLRKDVETIAEMLKKEYPCANGNEDGKGGGYSTFMVGTSPIVILSESPETTIFPLTAPLMKRQVACWG